MATSSKASIVGTALENLTKMGITEKIVENENGTEIAPLPGNPYLGFG